MKQQESTPHGRKDMRMSKLDERFGASRDFGAKEPISRYQARGSDFEIGGTEVQEQVYEHR